MIDHRERFAVTLDAIERSEQPSCRARAGTDIGARREPNVAAIEPGIAEANE